MSENNITNETLAKTYRKIAYGGCITTIVNLIFGPVIRFCLGWVGGTILKWCIGSQFTYVLNTLFETARFTRSMIPMLFAVISLFLGYVKVYEYTGGIKNG